MRLAVTMLALMAVAGPLRAEEHDAIWYAEAKMACIGDVMRLCPQFVPDEARVRACMTTKRAQVSEGCAEFYPGGKNAN